MLHSILLVWRSPKGHAVVKLNSMQRKALRVLIPLDCTDHMLDDLESGKADMQGMSYADVVKCADELERLGLLVTKKTSDVDCAMYLHSDAISYFRDSKVEVAKSLLKFAAQLLTGASGGVVVFMLARLFGA